MELLEMYLDQGCFKSQFTLSVRPQVLRDRQQSNREVLRLGLVGTVT